MSYSRFMNKDFAQINVNGSPLTFTNGSLDINGIITTVDESNNTTLSSSESGSLILKDNASSNRGIQISDDSNSVTISTNLTNSINPTIHLYNDYMMLQSQSTVWSSVVVDSNNLVVSNFSISQATNFSTTVALGNNTRPIIQIITQAPNIASGASASFTVSGSTITSNTCLNIETVYSGSAIPVVTTSNKTGGSFRINVYNAHGTNALNSALTLNIFISVPFNDWD